MKLQKYHRLRLHPDPIQRLPHHLPYHPQQAIILITLHKTHLRRHHPMPLLRIMVYLHPFR